MAKISPRHLQRELALKVLFSFFQHKKENIPEFIEYVRKEFFPKLKKTDFAEEIINQAVKHRWANNQWIREFAKSFSIDKTNPIDIVVLEILITEIFHLESKTPVPVAVNEGLTLASEYGKEWSVSFVNWVIAKIVKKYGETSEKNKN